jgi:hypothetical protein
MIRSAPSRSRPTTTTFFWLIRAGEATLEPIRSSAGSAVRSHTRGRGQARLFFVI